jgi:hypothetical protein
MKKLNPALHYIPIVIYNNGVVYHRQTMYPQPNKRHPEAKHHIISRTTAKLIAGPLTKPLPKNKTACILYAVFHPNETKITFTSPTFRQLFYKRFKTAQYYQGRAQHREDFNKTGNIVGIYAYEVQ